MAKQVIHIYGASGSGTSTLGQYIGEKMGYYWMDTDDYFWLPTNPPYTRKRKVSERIMMMRRDCLNSENVVISGSLVDWGDELIPLFTLAIRMETETDIRMKRIKKREEVKYGSRIQVGGDMYENHRKFMEWAAAYDMGGLEMRSKIKHDEWQKLLSCRQVTLDGSRTLEENFEIVRRYL